jgi:hypothetical protein
MSKPMPVLPIAIALLGGCKSKSEKGGDATAAGPTTPAATAATAAAETPRNRTVAEPATPPAIAPTPEAEGPGNPAVAESTPAQQEAPPALPLVPVKYEDAS